MECETGKRCFQTPQEAEAVCRKMRKGSGGRYRHSASARKNWSSGKLGHYKCPRCGAWHVGHDLPGGGR